jgi:ribonuclease VapC
VILDTSAILAILFDEPEREAFIEEIGAQTVVGVGAPTLTETSIVVTSRVGEAAGGHVTTFVERAAIVVVPFDAAHWRAAADAWLRFGQGRHQAGLNLGDCLSYATARVAGRPLLAKGDDFRRTDLSLAGSGHP